MYHDLPVIDVHGHISTPPAFRGYLANLISTRGPDPRGLSLPDADVRTSLERHLRLITERNIDVQMLSPRPIAMMQWERPYLVRHWTEVTNEVIAQECGLFPDRFVGVAQLPQYSGGETEECAETLAKCVEQYGFIAAIVNPDPGADRATPGMNEPYWFPLYEAAEALETPLLVHPSISRDPRLDIIPANYQFNNLIEETLAVLLLRNSDVFDRFPGLRVVVCHCGGSLQRLIEGGPLSGEPGSGANRVERELRDTSQNLFVDSCAYEPDFLRTAVNQWSPDNMLFGTECPGTGGGALNTETGRPSDDLLPVFERFEHISVADRQKIYYGNALRVYSRLAATPVLSK